jgi:hypothetical protein
VERWGGALSGPLDGVAHSMGDYVITFLLGMSSSVASQVAVH